MPPPSSEEEALYALTDPRIKLIELGSLVRSERIRADLLRVAGTIVRFLRGATPEQRRTLLGFSEAQLRVAVYAGIKLGEMLEQHKVAQGAPADLFARGLEERDRLYMALEGLADYEPRLAADIEAAHGRVMDAVSLAGSLAALVQLSKDLLSDRASRPSRLLELGGVTSEELASIETLSDTIKNTGEVPIDTQSTSVSKDDLDLQDGICLAHLERLMRIFNGAHDRDPSIPQLLPIATQSVFGPRQQLVAQHKEAEAPAASPAEAQSNGQTHASEWKEEEASAVGEESGAGEEEASAGEEEASAGDEEASAGDEEASGGDEEASAGDEAASAGDDEIKAAREREGEEG